MHRANAAVKLPTDPPCPSEPDAEAPARTEPALPVALARWSGDRTAGGGPPSEPVREKRTGRGVTGVRVAIAEIVPSVPGRGRRRRYGRAGTATGTDAVTAVL